jgi:DNA-binding response OmpR family regulator
MKMLRGVSPSPTIVPFPVCEDDPVLAAGLAMTVEEAGHTVCGVFHNARDALKSAAKFKPDLAFIDLKLADGNTGAAAAQALQSLGVPVVILSGHSNVGAGLGCVPHTFAAKPVSREVIEQLLAPATFLER